jgi:ubiquinone/menaquinone biosynthesis C-methylase UbiE
LTDGGFADHFSGVAATYARFRPTYPAGLFEWIAANAPTRNTAWDCACGNGQATLPIAEHFAHVYATDASASQLAEAPAHSRVSWRCGNVEASGLADASIDAVVIAQALHWLDTDRLWPEVRRVGVPGALVAAWTYGRFFTGDAAVDDVLHHFHDEVMGPYWPLNRGYVDTAYATIPFPFPRIDVPAFPMSMRWTVEELLGYVRSWSATQRHHAAGLADPLPALAAELAPRWGSVARRVDWPLTVLAGRLPR